MTTHSAVNLKNVNGLRAQRPADSHGKVHRIFLASLTLWAVGVVILASVGILERLPTRLVPLPIVTGISTLLLFYSRSAAFRHYIHALDLRNLTLFHLWRIPAALAFFFYGSQGELPLWFVRNAGWGDLVAGVLAPVAVFAFARSERFRFSGFVAFHIFSILDFVGAVGTGSVFSLLNDPLMVTLKEMPMALIPFFGVPVTGALSLMTLHRLFTRRA